MKKKSLPIVFMVVLAFWLATFSVSAVDVSLSLNSGTGNTVWFISGEPSLIINGFNLSNFGVTLPAQVRSLSISVNTAVPGVPIDAVVYQDANGGSPSDATFVGRKTVDITSSGVFTATFDTPLNITQPVIWVGFYLPVNFRFNADTSGSSVLTYWGWRPGETFDLSLISNATVLGPADGTAPVLINMGGIARISALVTTNSTTITLTPTLTPNGTITPGATVVPGFTTDSTGYMVSYSGCQTLLRDRGDLVITLREQFGLECQLANRTDIARLQPTPDGLAQRGAIYNITAYVGGRGAGAQTTNPFIAPVTHCIIADANDLDRGVIGLAWDLQRNWELQTTVRYGNMICAELLHPGYITYFVPA
jgi:hypothetical protein